MRQISLFIVLIFLFCDVHSQNISKWEYNKVISANSQKYELPINDNGTKVNCMIFLKKELKNLQKQSVNLVLVYESISQVGEHFHFLQTYNNIPIYGSEIKINVHNSKIISLFSKTVNTENWESNLFSDIYLSELKSCLKTNMTGEAVIFIQNNEVLPALKVVKTDIASAYSHEFIYDLNKKLLFDKNLAKNKSITHKDTNVKALVFLPDPITTAHKSYAGKYRDFDDAAGPELNNERKVVELNARYDSGYFQLKTKYLTLDDFSPPKKAVPIQTDNNFFYDRSEAGFEYVNAFYHISTYQNYLISIGFEGLTQYHLSVDAHALGDKQDDDQSQFVHTGNNTGKLYFGDGGVDDAEDADVIIHENGHALAFKANGLQAFGGELGALDEGNSDYMSCSYSKAINSYDWENIFNWDGHNEFWDGRKCISSKKYPHDLQHSIYDDAEIWTAALMEIHDNIGRKETDLAIFNSLYSYFYSMKMTDAAMLFFQADSILNGNKNSVRIVNIFKNRGLMKSGDSCVEGFDNDIFISINSNLVQSQATIKFSDKIDAHFHIFTIEGKLIKSGKVINQNQINIDFRIFKKGIYLISVTTKKGNDTFKVVVL